MGKQRGLRVACGSELLGGTLEAEAAEIGAEGSIDFPEHSFGNRESVCQILSHSGLLRTLAGKEKDDVHR
jgi:hypothetical protein